MTDSTDSGARSLDSLEASAHVSARLKHPDSHFSINLWIHFHAQTKIVSERLLSSMVETEHCSTDDNHDNHITRIHFDKKRQ